MSSFTDIDPRLIYAMFKGEPGTRKSTAALSFPMPQYWFSWDRKMQGILVPATKWGIRDKLMDKNQFQFDDFDNWDNARGMLEKFQVNCPFNTLVFDSITSCADMTLRQTLKAKSGMSRKSGTAAGKTIGGIPVNEIEDYNAESSALNELIALTKDIQHFNWKSNKRYINIILIAHVMEVTNKSLDGNMHTSRTIVTAGKRVAAKIPAYCSEVYHFGIKKDFDATKGGQYALVTENPGEDFARSALNLPREITIGDDPLYPKYILPAIEQLSQSSQSTNQPSNFAK